MSYFGNFKKQRQELTAYLLKNTKIGLKRLNEMDITILAYTADEVYAHKKNCI